MLERSDRLNVNDPDYGRWIPSYDALPVGTPSAATSPYRDLLQNHSYYIYTVPRPFDWFVYGFGINCLSIQVVALTLSISTDEEKENLSLRTIDASAVLGWPIANPEGDGGNDAQFNPHWLPLPGAHCFDESKGGIWGWVEAQGEEFNAGISAHVSRKKCRIERPPYKVTTGKQLRFILANRFTAILPTQCVTVVGARWLPWEGDQPARKIKR